MADDLETSYMSHFEIFFEGTYKIKPEVRLAEAREGVHEAYVITVEIVDYRGRLATFTGPAKAAPSDQ